MLIFSDLILSRSVTETLLVSGLDASYMPFPLFLAYFIHVWPALETSRASPKRSCIGLLVSAAVSVCLISVA